MDLNDFPFDYQVSITRIFSDVSESSQSESESESSLPSPSPACPESESESESGTCANVLQNESPTSFSFKIQ